MTTLIKRYAEDNHYRRDLRKLTILPSPQIPKLSPHKPQPNPPDEEAGERVPHNNTRGEKENPHDVCPSLSRRGYFTDPSIKDLHTYRESDLRNVSNFSVHHEKFGSVTWLGTTDITGLDIDDIVDFGEQTIEVYADDEHKPPEGRELNKPAEVCLKGCWPMNKQTRRREPTDDARRLQKYERKLADMCERRNGMNFVSYDYRSGMWRFRVAHFSKYGVPDSDDESGDENQNKSQSSNQLRPPANQTSKP